MKKQLNLTFFMVLLFSLSLVFGLSVSFNQYQEKKRIRSAIVEMSKEVENYYLSMNLDVSFVEFFADSSYRVTVVSSDFTEVTDAYQILDNDVISNQEFKEVGAFVTRYDQMLDEDYIYYVSILPDNNYLRIGYSLEAYQSDQNNYILGMLFLLLVIILTGYLLTSKWVKRIFEPMDTLISDIDYLKVNQSFFKIPLTNQDELDELILRINHMNHDIEDSTHGLSQQKELLDILLNHSNQGVLIFSSDQEVVLQNRLFDFKELNELISQNLGRVIDHHLVETFQLSNGNQVYQIRMASVTNKNLVRNRGKNGVLVLIEDVTNKVILEKNKRDFFANASHELRSPLTSIRGEAELILYDMVTDSEKQELASKIIKQAGLMDNLLTDMLLLSKLENRPQEIKQPVQLDVLLNEVFDDFMIQIKEKSISIEKDISHAVLLGNPTDFRSLFKNLIENAIKYNQINGSITVQLTQKRQSIEFVIKDTGIGISRQHQERVFERFYQVNKHRNQVNYGTGLGLSIVKHIVQQYHGQIEVDSELNKGTKFTITFSALL